MTVETEPLTPEEEALLDALDRMPGRIIALVRAKLSGAVSTTKTRNNLHAMLDRLFQELQEDEIEVVEERYAGRMHYVETREP